MSMKVITIDLLKGDENLLLLKYNNQMIPSRRITQSLLNLEVCHKWVNGT